MLEKQELSSLLILLSNIPDNYLDAEQIIGTFSNHINEEKLHLFILKNGWVESNFEYAPGLAKLYHFGKWEELLVPNRKAVHDFKPRMKEALLNLKEVNKINLVDILKAIT